jgi:hypothetical protein
MIGRKMNLVMSEEACRSGNAGFSVTHLKFPCLEREDWLIRARPNV